MMLFALSFSLPIEDPILKFLIILIIILCAPLLLNKLKIPPLLGLIIAGAVIGPYGINLVSRDSSIIMSGTAGLLYIMFLAGMEIDMNDFKKNSLKSLTFGMYTFWVPLLVGTVVGKWILGFSWMTSVLLASMFASHTLIAYPIISKYGIVRNPAVGITVGGTMVTDMLALLVLTIVVGMTTGEVNTLFWIRLAVSIIIFTALVIFVFPLIGRWFFKQVDDSISQYIFVLSLLFFGSFLAQLAGIEGIIGAFLCGLALNRLIPRSSPLMNRIEFVGNAIFIPFFLLGVGMLVDYRAFFNGWETIEVGLVMIIVATGTKFIAAWLTQKTFHFSLDQRRVIFGLSNAQAAATLAAVMVGYNIILGTDVNGQPVRLLNESVLNGTILMILVTCTIATFVAQKGAQNIALHEIKNTEAHSSEKTRLREHILIPVSNKNTVEELINLSLAIKSPANKDGLYALRVINSNESDEAELKRSRTLLDKAVHTAAAADVHVHDLIRYDLSTTNAITSVVCENGITDMVLGLHQHKSIPADFLGKIADGILCSNGVNTFIYKSMQPLATIKRNIFLMPPKAEKELGFVHVMRKIKTIIANTGALSVLYGSHESIDVAKTFFGNDAEVEYREFDDWNDFLIVFRDVKSNDCMWVFLSRKDGVSYHPVMPKIPGYLNKYFRQNNFILVYPEQGNPMENGPFLI